MNLAKELASKYFLLSCFMHNFIDLTAKNFHSIEFLPVSSEYWTSWSVIFIRIYSEQLVIEKMVDEIPSGK